MMMMMMMMIDGGLIEPAGPAVEASRSLRGFPLF